MGEMSPDTRAMVAAAAYAYISGRKVAGMHDHAAGRDRRIAAEARGEQLQGYDGDRAAGFGGSLPDLFDAGTNSFVALRIEGANAEGYDHQTATAFAVAVSDQRAQVYDHGQRAWFTFDLQLAG